MIRVIKSKLSQFFKSSVNQENRQLGIDTKIPKKSKLTPLTRIGDYTRFNGPVKVKGNGVVRFGNFCAVGEGLIVISSSHDPAKLNLQLNLFDQAGINRQEKASAIDIGHNAWIGDRVTLLPGAGIGPCSVIGAGAVVTRKIPPFVVAAGNPARIIRKRCKDDVAEYLMTLAWWNWPLEKIVANKKILDIDISKIRCSDLQGIAPL